MFPEQMWYWKGLCLPILRKTPPYVITVDICSHCFEFVLLSPIFVNLQCFPSARSPLRVVKQALLFNWWGAESIKSINLPWIPNEEIWANLKIIKMYQSAEGIEVWYLICQKLSTDNLFAYFGALRVYYLQIIAF